LSIAGPPARKISVPPELTIAASTDPAVAVRSTSEAGKDVPLKSSGVSPAATPFTPFDRKAATADTRASVDKLIATETPPKKIFDPGKKGPCESGVQKFAVQSEAHKTARMAPPSPHRRQAKAQMCDR
jgi:hypothetical protein